MIIRKEYDLVKLLAKLGIKSAEDYYRLSRILRRTRGGVK